MRFIGIEDTEYKRVIQDAHNEAMTKLQGLTFGFTRDQRVQSHLDSLNVDISGKLATCAGKVRIDRNNERSLVKMNYRLLKGNNAEIRDTYLHELAHIIAEVGYAKRCGHNRHWKHVARTIGAKPERCHTIKTTHLKNKVKRHAFACKCRQWMLTTNRLNRYDRYKASTGRSPFTCPDCKTQVILILPNIKLDSNVTL